MRESRRKEKKGVHISNYIVTLIYNSEGNIV